MHWRYSSIIKGLIRVNKGSKPVSASKESDSKFVRTIIIHRNHKLYKKDHHYDNFSLNSVTLAKFCGNITNWSWNHEIKLCKFEEHSN